VSNQDMTLLENIRIMVRNRGLLHRGAPAAVVVRERCTGTRLDDFDWEGRLSIRDAAPWR
jgi:hypothetical protein